MRASYEERQEKWIRRHNVKIGDIVTVFRKYDPKTCGEWTREYV